MKTLILALMLLVPKTWEQGKLVSITPDKYLLNGRTYLAYIVTVTTPTLEIQGRYSHMLHTAFSGSDAPKVIENDAIKYRIDHQNLFLLDTEGKEIKLKIIKTRKP